LYYPKKYILSEIHTGVITMQKNRPIIRGLALLLCLSMLVGFAPAGIFGSAMQVEAVTNDNLIQNGGFDGDATGWKTSAGAQAKIEYVEGTMQFTAAVVTDDGGATLNKTNTSLIQDFTVASYDTYELTLSYKWISGETKPYVSAWFYKGKVTNENYCGSSVQYVEDKSGEWVTVTVTAVAPAGATTMRVEIGTHTSATVSFAIDDVKLVKKNTYVYAEMFDAYNSSKPAAGPAGWSDGDVSNKGQVSCVSGANAYAGSALQFQLADALWAKSPTFDVKAGYDYTVEFMAKKSLNNGHFTGYAEIVFLNEAGKEVGSYDRIVGKTFTEWTKESFIALAPAGAVKAYFIFGCETKLGAYAVDELTVTESDAPSTRDPSKEDPDVPPVYVLQLLDPSFEEGGKGWKSFTGAGATATFVTDDVYAGQNALQIKAVPTETEKAATYRAQSLDIEGIEALELSIMSKRLSGDGKAYVMLAFYDADNKLVPADTAFMTSIALEETWAKTTMIQAVPKTAVSVTVEFGNSTNQTISYLVDDLKIGVYTGPKDEINPAVPAQPAPPSGSDGIKVYTPGQLNNSFEELDEYGRPTIWWTTGNAKFKIVEAADAPNGKYVFQMEKISGGPSIRSGYIAVEPGKTYDLKLMMKDLEIGKSSYLNLNVYDAEGKLMPAECKLVTTDGSGKWKMYVISMVAPEGAGYMNAEIWYTTAGSGAVQVDAMILEESDTPAKLPFRPSEFTAPTIEDILESMNPEHPRIYYTAEEGKQIKLRRFNTLKTKYGFTWNEKYNELLKLADAYLERTQVKVSMNTGKHVMMDVYPVLRDPNDPYYDPIYIEASLDENGELFDKTVWTGFGSLVTSQLRDMMQVWCLAYTMTGKHIYADRAIEFAMQVADWQWWGDYDWMILSGVKTDASMGWMTVGMATVYDVLYHELTEEQREKIERSIIEKSLAPLSADVKPLDTQNVNMMKMGGLLAGCAAIISEDNIEEIKPYLDVALLCAHNALDNYAFSGNTEGHYYTDYGLESFIVGIGQICKATNVPGLIDHPFFAEILPYWTVMWGAPGNGTHPNYSDSSIGAYMRLPMAVLSNLTKNPIIDGFLINSKGTGDSFYDLLYLNPEPNPEYLTDYAGVVDGFGYGVLRTGFASEDMMLTLKSNDSQMSHNHLDQNGILFNFGGNWLIQDPGVGSYYYTDRRFWTTNGHSVVLVDGSAQMMRGKGSTQMVFNNKLYSYIIGTAPDTYGSDYDGKVLEKFDRHAIQINHEDKGYYLIIDDLLSTKNREYAWQMYNGNRQQFSIDGETVETGSALGNTVSMPIGSSMLNVNFISKDQLLMEDVEHTNGDGSAKFGKTFTATATAATKAHQFMTLISVAENKNKNFLTFLDILNNRRFTLPEKLDDPADLTWDSSMPMGQEIIKENLIDSSMCLFFRGNRAGDYINIPFTLEEAGKYELTLNMGASTGCCKIKATIDGVHVSAVTDCSGWPEYMVDIPFGELELAEGHHDLKIEIVGPGENEGYEPGWYLINACGLDMQRVGVEVAESKDVVVTEVYDTEDVIGGLINYIDNKYDLLMFNRKSGSVAMGKLTSDAQQASVLGIVEGVVTEGFAATGATTLSYDGKTLFTSDKKVDIVASSTGWQIIAAEEGNITLTAIAPEKDYFVTVNGEKADLKIENGALTVALAAGENHIVVAEEVPVEDPTDPTNPTDPGDNDPTEGTQPTQPTQPGEADGNDATLWIILAVIVVLLAGAAVAVVLVLKKRKSVN